MEDGRWEMGDGIWDMGYGIWDTGDGISEGALLLHPQYGMWNVDDRLCSYAGMQVCLTF
jgi:hypothetical protein